MNNYDYIYIVVYKNDKDGDEVAQDGQFYVSKNQAYNSNRYAIEEGSALLKKIKLEDI